jgi:Lantibiotic dehydratase, N terminus
MTEFAAPRAGWSRARYHCPDLMIAAADAEAIRRGEYVFVLGEMHVALNTIATYVFVNQHPRPLELLNLLDQDLGAGNLVRVPPKDMSWASRTLPLTSPHDLSLEFSLDGFARDRSRAIPVSSLLMERSDDEILARTADGQVFNALELVGWRLSEMIFNAFKMFSPSAHTPRISIDRLVVKRESWRFTTAELAFAAEQDGSERFLQCRAWAQTYNLPRFVFYKVPVEKKPAYLDLNSPILVDIFCRMVRSTIDAKLPDAMIEVAEMLPDVEQMWLSDANGDHYSCELRIVALDLVRCSLSEALRGAERQLDPIYNNPS